MYFKQIPTPGLGCFSYCIGCPKAGAMVVVDPKRDIGDYLDIARDEGMTVTRIINTHVHADHVSGDQELRAATGATILNHAEAPVTYPCGRLNEGDVLEIGAARLEILHTPGHTPHSLSILVTDLARSPEPQLILTGDLLFVGDVGRPDLAGADIIADQARNLHDSLYVKLARFPDHLEVFPGHGQGSLCGRGMSAKPSTTLGYERRANPMLRFGSFEDFKQDILSVFPSRPKSFSHIIATNLKGAPLLEACPTDKALTPGQFESLMRDGAVVIDARDAASFGGLHVPGSLNIGFEKQLANWVGMVVEPNSDLLLVVESRQDYERMLVELHRIGYDRVFGYLSGGVRAWLLSGRPVEQLTQIAPRQLAERQGPQGPRLIDVRTPAEREVSRIAGAEHIPLPKLLAEGLEDRPDREIVVHCASGYRSNIAASFLKKQGFENAQSLAGGVLGWKSAGLPLA